MLTWGALLFIAAGVYGQLVLGMTLSSSKRLSGPWIIVLSYIPVAILSAVIALQTLTHQGELQIDARVVGITAAALCCWRQWPMAAVVTIAALATGFTRLIL